MIIIVYDAPHNEAFCIGYNIYCSWCIFQYHIHAFFILWLQLSHLFFCWNLYIWNAGSVWFANNLIVFFSELQFKWMMIKLLDWLGYLTSYFFRHKCIYRTACLAVISFYVQFFKTSLFLTFSKYKYTLAHITEAFCIGYNIYCSWCIFQYHIHAFSILWLQLSLKIIYSILETYMFGMQASCGLKIILLFSFLSFISNGWW